MGYISDLKQRISDTGKKLRSKQDNYDSPWDKITHPEWFDDNNNRTKAHPAAGKPRDPKSSLPVKMAKGGSTASKRADGCATKGKTKGRFV